MKILLSACLIFLCSIVYCQRSKTEIIDPEKLTFKELKLTAQRSAPATIRLPFSSIKIVDSRFDTTKLGFLPTSSLIYDKKSVFSKIRFKGGGVAKPLEEYYNDYYQKSFTANGFELLIVMKRFWLSGIDYTRDKRIVLTNSLETATNLYFKWEYYLGKEGKYMPLKRVDTLMQVSDEQAASIDEDFHERRLNRFKFTLKAMIELYDFSSKVELFDKQPAKTMDEILNFNAKRNEIVILKDSTFKKGVYLSFEEFKNNTPSIKDYKEEKTRYKVFKKERYLTDANGNLITEYWGYSDGEEFRYGKFGNDKLFRIGNTFQFFVQMNNAEINTDPNAATGKDLVKVWFPYQIDMETGNVY